MSVFNITPGGDSSWLGHTGTANGSENALESVAMSLSSARDSLCIALDSQYAAIAWPDAGGSKLAIHDVTNGTTGTVVTLASFTGVAIQGISSTKFAVLWFDGSFNTVLRTYTVSGTTITQDATLTVTTNSSATYTHSMTVLSSTIAHVTYYNGANVVVEKVTIGSGTLTAGGSAATIISGGSVTQAVRGLLQKVSSSTSIYVYGGASSVVTAVVVSDGAPCVVNTPVSLFTSSTNAARSTISPLSSNNRFLLMTNISSANNQIIGFSVSGTTITSDGGSSTLSRRSSARNGSISPLVYIESVGTKDYFAYVSSGIGANVDKAVVVPVVMDGVSDIRYGLGASYGDIGSSDGNNTGALCVLSTSKLGMFYAAASTAYPSVRAINK